MEAIKYPFKKRVFAVTTFKVLWEVVFFFRQSKKTCGILWSVRVFFSLQQVRRQNKYYLRGKFNFLYVGIEFDMTKCKFITRNDSFKMLVLLLCIFVEGTIVFVCNFVASLIKSYARF